jgi:predicted RNA-binding protein YlqC (UPF0109 family)
VTDEDVDSGEADPAVDLDHADPNEVDPNAVDPNEVDEQDDDLDDDEAADANAVPAANARSVLEYLVRSVVDNPDAVQISVSEGQRVTSLDVRVGDGDMGRVIGKRGRIAQAIRTVVRAAAVKDGVSVDIEFVD